MRITPVEIEAVLHRVELGQTTFEDARLLREYHLTLRAAVDDESIFYGEMVDQNAYIAAASAEPGYNGVYRMYSDGLEGLGDDEIVTGELHFCLVCDTRLQEAGPGKWQCPNCE